MAQVTLYQVAAKAGVSLATASRVLNGSTRRVGEPLRHRVMQAARELRYAANGPAQAMARGHSNTLGLLVGDIADPYFTQIAAGVAEAADAEGITVTIGTTNREIGREVDLVAGFRSQRARGVVMVGSRFSDGSTDTTVDLGQELADEVSAYQDTGGVVVLISQPAAGLPVVEIDNHRLAEQLAEALVQLGHREFAVLAGPAELLTAADRAEGFLAGLRGHGIELGPEKLVHGGFTRSGGRTAMAALLNRTRSPGCVFAVNDVMALGAMAAMREAGLRPGADIPIAGFDDIPTLADVQPGLTTVNLPLREAGRRAVALLLQAESADAAPTTHPLAGNVILRESTAIATP